MCAVQQQENALSATFRLVLCTTRSQLLGEVSGKALIGTFNGMRRDHTREKNKEETVTLVKAKTEFWKSMIPMLLWTI